MVHCGRHLMPALELHGAQAAPRRSRRRRRLLRDISHKACERLRVQLAAERRSRAVCAAKARTGGKHSQRAAKTSRAVHGVRQQVWEDAVRCTE